MLPDFMGVYVDDVEQAESENNAAASIRERELLDMESFLSMATAERTSESLNASRWTRLRIWT